MSASVILETLAGLPSKVTDRIPIRMKVIMSATTATPKQGKVIASVLTQYRALVENQQEGIRAFIIKNAKVNQRDLGATLEEGKKSGAISAIRPAYANYFQFAGEVLESAKWAKSVEVSDFMAEVAVCQRSAGAEGAREILKRSTSWADFSKATRKAEELKKAKRAPSNRAKKAPKGASVGVEVMAGELVIPDTVAGVVTVGMALKFFANRLDSAEDISLSADEIILAEKVAKRLTSLAKVAKGANHPAGKARA